MANVLTTTSWGSLNVPKDIIVKLESRSQKCIFLGYGSDYNYGYQLWNLIKVQMCCSMRWQCTNQPNTWSNSDQLSLLIQQLFLLASLIHSISYSASSWSCTSDPPYKSMSSPLQKRSSAMIWWITRFYHTVLTDCLIHENGIHPDILYIDASESSTYKEVMKTIYYAN